MINFIYLFSVFLLFLLVLYSIFAFINKNRKLAKIRARRNKIKIIKREK